MKPQLTREESQHLIDLGIPEEKASVRHIELTLEEYRVFNLTDLLEILPKEIDNHHSLNICYIRNQWWSEYISYITEEAIVQKEGIELIDSLYELCVWCLESKYLKF